MQWWCSAQSVPWSWTWRPYIGVWLLVLALAAWLHLLHARAGAARQPWRMSMLVQGLLLLWLALDWPIGALGGGYLASVHMLQFLLIALVVPPLLLLAVHPEVWAGLERRGAPRWLSGATTPLMGLVLLNATVLATHLPVVVDTLMASQLGSFAIDMAWMLSGLAFWWPVVAPVPARPRFAHPLRMGYLMLGIMFSPVTIALVAVLVFNRQPLFATYELAPRVTGLSAVSDHQVAGLMMSVGGALVTLVAMTILFFQWVRASEAQGPDGSVHAA